MFLICGIGNFGKQYAFTRHNVGFEVLDILSQKYNTPVLFKEKFKAQIAQTTIANHSVILLKPHTYMNLSGQSVQIVTNYYKILPENVIVIHDDLDLELANVRLKIGGSSAGHNGIKSIHAAISQNYMRIRVGIGRPNNSDVADYVLQQFSKKEKEIIQIVYYKIADAIELLLNNKIDQFIANINQ